MKRLIVEFEEDDDFVDVMSALTEIASAEGKPVGQVAGAILLAALFDEDEDEEEGEGDEDEANDDEDEAAASTTDTASDEPTEPDADDKPTPEQ